MPGTVSSRFAVAQILHQNPDDSIAQNNASPGGPCLLPPRNTVGMVHAKLICEYAYMISYMYIHPIHTKFSYKTYSEANQTSMQHLGTPVYRLFVYSVHI